MGNTQGATRRDRSDSGGKRFSEDEYPVQLKIPRSLGNNNSTPSMQYEDTCEYPIVIKWSGAAKHVAISGSWNGWKCKIPLVKSHDDFTTIINLPEGKHEFKYCVDGVWVCDNTQLKTDNGLGGENNILTIDKGDFEVFDALDKDSQTGGVGSDQLGGSLSALSPDLAYNQDIPDRKTFEKASHPPVLPPHLLQVILNKDTPISCDPNVLPEPNHVMLNHLYALSIKEGVMVLSATHRYRKKYVTTLLYKPI